VCCSVLQCVAVCCSVLQCVAVCCSVLQRVAVCCSVLQCVAECCREQAISNVVSHTMAPIDIVEPTRTTLLLHSNNTRTAVEQHYCENNIHVSMGAIVCERSKQPMGWGGYD